MENKTDIMEKIGDDFIINEMVGDIQKQINYDYKAKQDNITKLALYNTATAIYGNITIDYEDYQEQMMEKSKRIVNIAKYLWKEMEKDWNE